MLPLEVEQTSESTSLLENDTHPHAVGETSMSRIAWMIVILATCGVIAAAGMLIDKSYAKTAAAKSVLIKPKAEMTRLSKEYFLMSKVGSLEEAIALCDTDGAEIASITSRKENIAAFKVLVNHADADVWLGLIQGNTLNQWFWLNNDKYVYSNWRADEPNNVGQHCVQMKRYEDGVWNDIQCEGVSMYVLCQKQVPPPTPSPTPKPTQKPPIEVCEKDGVVCHWFGDQNLGQQYCCDTCLNPTVPCNDDICNPDVPIHNFCLCTQKLCLLDGLSKKNGKKSLKQK